ncbi:hypothetical protein ACHHYP_16892 [Achlya hypogyna]|uniref:Tyrosinase copper-binding domain-containing protein n=1 Tax=Achlya hypogyna TaxID=1202772 RepID=A0A1V9Y5I4_ACHHY|nr:hypothetical protein ACHHYP_16892 [Achlya hypogyna]
MASTCSKPRVRKSWDALTPIEKATYIAAIELAMDLGYYERFLSMHRENMSNMQAHDTCVFMYWHRQYLVGFENMLRSLKPEFGCITIPYFDYVNDNAKYMTNTCSTIDTCSKILNELGSASSGKQVSVVIGDSLGQDTIDGRCDATAPLGHFVQYQVGTQPADAAMHCVPRGQYNATYFPDAVSFTYIKDILFGSGDVATMNSDIELGPHGYMHITLNGAMYSGFVSPADPIFFSHHSLIDSLNAIYYKCRVAPEGLTDAQKQTDVRSFEGCMVNDAPITANSSIYMRAIVDGATVDVHDETMTQSFFAAVPTKYYELTDNTNLGVNSYSYEFSGLLADLYTNCAQAGLASGSRRRLRDARVPKTARDARGHLQNYIVSTPKADAPHLSKYAKWRAAIVAVAKDLGWSDVAIEEEVFKIVTMFYHDCLPGGLHKASPRALAHWHIVPEESKADAVLASILDGSDPIRLPGWQEINAKYLSCKPRRGHH